MSFEQPPVQKKKLMIVDDEAEIVDFLSSFFSERNYDILTASSVEEALEILKREKPAIILQDLRMRGNKTAGFEVVVKAKELSPSSKAIMVSAVEDQVSIEEALKLGAVDYITKPLSLEYLENTVIEKLKEVSGN